MSAYVSVLDDQDRPLKQFQTTDGRLIEELIKNPPAEATYAVIQYYRSPGYNHIFSIPLNVSNGIARSSSLVVYASVRYVDPSRSTDGVPHRFESLSELIDLLYRLFPELNIPKAQGADVKPSSKLRERDTPKAGRRKTRRRYHRRYSDGVVRDERRARSQKVSASRRLGV